MHTRRSEEAEASIAETRACSTYDLLPDDVFNHIGRFCSPNFAFILASREIFRRSRCDTKNGFLFDLTTLIHAQCILPNRDRVDSLLKSFANAPDDVFAHLYQTIETGSRWADNYTQEWNGVVRSRHLLRILKCPSLATHYCIHPFQIYVHVDIGTKTEMLQHLIVDLVMSNKLSDEDCAARISMLYWRIRIIDTHAEDGIETIYKTQSDDTLVFEQRLFNAYLSLPRSEKNDIRFRAILSRIFLPASMDIPSGGMDSHTGKWMAMLASHLFGSAVWTEVFKLGRLPLDICLMFVTLWRVRSSSPGLLLQAQELFGADNIPRVAEQWARGILDIIIASPSPYSYLSMRWKSSPCEDYDPDPAYRIVTDLVISLVDMYFTLPIDLPWVNLFLWLRRHWVSWRFWGTKSQLKFLHIAAKEHFLSGLLALNMASKIAVDENEIPSWIHVIIRRIGFPLPDYFDYLLRFLMMSNCDFVRDEGIEAKDPDSDMKKTIEMSLTRTRHWTWDYLCSIIRAAEQENAHLIDSAAKLVQI